MCIFLWLVLCFGTFTSISFPVIANTCSVIIVCSTRGMIIRTVCWIVNCNCAHNARVLRGELGQFVSLWFWLLCVFWWLPRVYFVDDNNNNNIRTIFIVLSSWPQAIARVHSVHLMNCRTAHKWPSTLRPSHLTWAVSPPVGSYRLQPPLPFIIITQPEKLILIYRPT